jgi:hypothetical protein
MIEQSLFDGETPPLVNKKDGFIHYLCEEVKNCPNQDIKQNCRIELGETGEESAYNLGLLNYFRNEKIIIDYSSPVDESIVEPDETESEISVTQCEIVPSQLIRQIKKIWEPNKLHAENLNECCDNLMKLIDIYFRNPEKRTEKLYTAYEQTCDKIKRLLNEKEGFEGLRCRYTKPFSSLFAAEKEMTERKITLSTINSRISAFRGDICKLLTIYSANTNEEEQKERENIFNELGLLNVKKNQLINNQNKGIEEIVVITKNEDRKFKVVVNGNYLNSIIFDYEDKVGKAIYDLADKQDVFYNQTAYDQLNSTIGCKLYSKTDCRLTHIAKKENSLIIPNIPFRIISADAFTRRYNQMKKRDT